MPFHMKKEDNPHSHFDRHHVVSPSLSFCEDDDDDGVLDVKDKCFAPFSLWLFFYFTLLFTMWMVITMMMVMMMMM